MSLEHQNPLVVAVLKEIEENLKLFLTEQKEHTIFINKLPLALPDREAIRDFLGVGSLTIELSDSDEPAKWVESAVSGIWFGVFYSASQEPILETIEICSFPKIAAAQTADVEFGLAQFSRKLQEKEAL
ncbi:MAG: hydrogenase expression/formation C-terminal domain-containing protein [Sporomusaceae bacterium]|nr:hydrogenase expression/formation C-terminal domain-containing protein [Sporomusaceae bacterium]